MEAFKLKEGKTLEELLNLNSIFRSLLDGLTKEQFLNNNIKTSHSGCPQFFGFDKQLCISNCKQCWKNVLKDYEW